MKLLKTLIIFFSIILIISVFSFSCKKDKNSSDITVSIQLKLDSLIAENTVISPGGATKIKAYAKGEGITYQWSVPLGDILGSGQEITYIAPPCTLGVYNITCKVTDKAKNTQSKTITITVK